MAGFYTYLDAHSIAETRHWHDDHPADLVFFPTAFIVSNPDEVLKKMEPLKKYLANKLAVQKSNQEILADRK